jgi:hypothetical protein
MPIHRQRKSRPGVDFEKGNPGGPGRRPGTPNKTTVAVKDAIMMAADRLGGVERLVAWCKEKPVNERLFWTQIYTKLLPLKIRADIRHALDLSKLTDEELLQVKMITAKAAMPIMDAEYNETSDGDNGSDDHPESVN